MNSVNTALSNLHDNTPRYLRTFFCIFYVCIIFVGKAHASTPATCSWDIQVLGKTLSKTLGDHKQAESKLVLGIAYKDMNRKNNIFYGFATNVVQEAPDYNLINKLAGINAEPLQKVLLNSVIEEGTFSLEKNVRLQKIVFLVASRQEIRSLERLQARIVPVFRTSDFIRRGGSDFSGPLPNQSIKIANLNFKKVNINGSDICSYMVN